MSQNTFHYFLPSVLDDLGSYTFPMSTSSELAQRYFNQGLILAFGFNHAEAFRSLQAAAQLDPTCAMCYWGMAYVLGPNINAAMEGGDVPTAYEAIQRAIALSNHATERERAYIQALAQRYSAEPVDDRAELDAAYAAAMGELARQYPDDPDAASLYAEALMDTMPWDYWNPDGSAKPETTLVLNTLESVMERHPEHPMALHLYIHAVEKEHPALGIAAADRLRDLVPGAGHLVHMPGHIYIRVGRYHDAVVANLKAVAADESYVTQCHAQGLYPIGYMPHNHHFLWFAAVMAGQKDIAIEAAHHTAMVDSELMRQPGYGTLQHYFVTPLYTLIKFAAWDQILAQPAPDVDLAYPTAVWHYARGLAFANRGQLIQAQRELQAMEAISTSTALDGVTIWDINTTAHLMQIAQAVLRGEIAAQSGDFEEAIAQLQQGVELEGSLNYDEPSPWYSPVRQQLGTVLLEANRPAEAEAVFRADLAIYPDNGWSLHGLAQALQTQEKSEAATVQSQFEVVWEYADYDLSSSD
jgi:tetratricopeptide (TPR) repeat protein